MRFPFTKIYRAFPELDTYRDDQCERFVNAARGRRWQRLLRVGVTIAVGFVGQVVLWLMIGYVSNFIPSNTTGAGSENKDGLFIVLGLLLLFPLGLIGFLPAIFLRDRMLLGQIRKILIERGSCMQCHYSLIGLPVFERQFVKCPTCKKPVVLKDTENPECPKCEEPIGLQNVESEWVVICSECGCPGVVDSSLSELTVSSETSTVKAADD